MKFVKEFKEFAIKGNAFDLAIGVIIGAAFGKIVTSIIEDLIMPIVAALIKKPDFSSIYFAIGKDASKIPSDSSLINAKKIAPDAAIFAYGNFITISINFLLLAFIVFLMMKGSMRLKRKKEPLSTELSSTDKLLSEILNELKNKS